MTARRLVMLSAAIEAATGVALIVVPGMVSRVLLGADLSSSGTAVARVTGFGLLSLGMACWSRNDVTAPAIWALFTYNLLAAPYFAYLRVGEGFVGYLLWPAFALHALLALLLARSAYERVLAAKAAQANSH